jgi:hypothetical protein
VREAEAAGRQLHDRLVSSTDMDLLHVVLLSFEQSMELSQAAG